MFLIQLSDDIFSWTASDSASEFLLGYHSEGNEKHHCRTMLVDILSFGFRMLSIGLMFHVVHHIQMELNPAIITCDKELKSSD